MSSSSFTSPSLPQSFTLVNDKAAAAPLVACAWCPTMDLLALVTSHHALHVHRLSWERLFSLQLDHATAPLSSDWRCAGVAWRPDGKALAVAGSDGSLRLVGLESRRVEATVDAHGGRRITALTWTRYSGSDEGSGRERTKKRSARRPHTPGAVWKRTDVSAASLPLSSRSARLFGPLPPLPVHSASSSASAAGPAPSPVPFASSSAPSASDSSTVPSADVTADGDQQTPSLLVTANDSGVLHARLHGTLDVLHMDVRACMPASFSASAVSVVSLCVSPSFERLHAVVACEERLLRVRVELPWLAWRVHELSLLACEAQHIGRLLAYTVASLSAVTTRYASIRQSLHVKFAPLSSAVDEEQQQHEASTPRQRLIHLVLTGVPSQSVRQWVQSTLNPAALLRQCAGVESGLLRMAEVMRSHVRRAAEEVVHRLAEVRGWGRWKERGDALGVEEATVSALLGQAALVLLRVDEVLLLLARMRRVLTAFFQWLVHAVSGLQREEDEAEAKAHPSGPFDLDDVVECIQLDLFTDRLAPLLSSTTPQPLVVPLSPGPSPVAPAPPLPVSSIPVTDSPASLSLLAALDALRASFTAFTQAPCVAISPRIVSAQRRRPDDVIAVKPVQEAVGSGATHEDVAQFCDDKRDRALLAFSIVHPLVPHPLLVIASTAASSASSPRVSPSVLILPCPGLTSSSHAVVVALSLFSGSSLLVLVRYSVQRRSSELRLLHDQDRMVGNTYTRLYQLALGPERTWPELRERERRMRDSVSRTGQ